MNKNGEINVDTLVGKTRTQLDKKRQESSAPVIKISPPLPVSPMLDSNVVIIISGSGTGTLYGEICLLESGVLNYTLCFITMKWD